MKKMKFDKRDDIYIYIEFPIVFMLSNNHSLECRMEQQIRYE
jgi:hypothetical protein